MASSLSDLVNDLAKASCKINKNTIMIKKSGKLAELNKKIVSVFLNTKTLKMVSKNANACSAINVTKKACW